MRWLLTTQVYSFVLLACTSSKQAETHFRKLEQFCQRAVANEDRPSESIIDSGLGIKVMSMKSIGSDFWKAYSDARLAAGDRRTRKELKALLERYGASVAMLVPINDDLRGAEDNAIIDAWLASGGRTTAYLKRLAGNPPNLQRTTAFRLGVLRGY